MGVNTNRMTITKIVTAAAFALTLAMSSAFAAETTHAACCEKAKAAGKECEHKCCVEAKKENKPCEKCSKPKKD